MTLTPTEHSFECREVPLQRVLVYNDRAEVTRVVRVSLTQGFNEILLKNVTSQFIADTVRVGGRGEAIIHEVQFHTKPASKEEVNNVETPRVKDITALMEEKELQGQYLNDEKRVVDKKIEALDQLFSQVSLRQSRSNDKVELKLDKETLEQITHFFEFYEAQSLEAHKKSHKLNNELTKLKEDFDKLQKEKNDLTESKNVFQPKPLAIRQFSILVESEKGGEAELEVVYQVKGASWSPRYDIRVDTGDKKDMKITYSALIKQWTGEDWKNTSLVLSTARPSLGGRVPELGTLEASFHSESVPVFQEHRGIFGGLAHPKPPTFGFAPAQSGGLFGSSTNTSSASLFGAPSGGAPPPPPPPPPEMKVAVADVVLPSGDHALATEFEIARPSTIPSDSVEHRVTIGVVSTEPRLLHECVPSKNRSVFLTATAVNSSAFPFLAGPAAIYLDGSFVTNIGLKEVSPGERFSCSLGVDTAIRVEYKSAHERHGQIGVISKAASVEHEQHITVKNSRGSGESVLLSLREHLPKSTTERIAVRLASPETKSLETKDEDGPPSLGAFIDENNNLLWNLKLEPKCQVDLLVKWSIEYPVGEKLKYRERY